MAIGFLVGFLTIGTVQAEMRVWTHAQYPGDPVKATGASEPWFDDFQKGWEESKRRGVPMVVFITMDRCLYCDAMKKDTWCDQSILEKLGGEFVPIRLHRDRDANLLSRIKVPAYPTTLLASPEGKVLAHRVGYQPPSAMHHVMQEIRSGVLRR